MIIMDYLEELTTRRGYCQRQLLPHTKEVLLYGTKFIQIFCKKSINVELKKT